MKPAGYCRKIKRFFGLTVQFAIADFKLRNEGSYLGVLWYLLNPVLMFALLFLIFNDRLGKDIPNYPIYLLLGIIIFNLFQSATTESARSIIREHHYLIKSINFPRESLIASIALRNLFSHLFEIMLFVIALLLFKVNIFYAIYYLPLILLFLLFIFGASLILSSLTVYFVDLDNIWSFAVRIIWLATPVFYAIEGQERLYYLNLFNPLFYFITAARDAVIYGKIPEAWLILGLLGFSAGFFLVGLFIFGKLKNKFAEMI